ncbi:VOC family protein [Ralstonia flaminis]|uniref:VOC family protein n=1 Tax=Ralstonia flaminis TaxID=3058597 RepID=UPI0029314B71|nr:VOC family protein [Ralstonia sp. LMG 18101]
MIALDHISLRVRDLARSITFYSQVLGFRHEGQHGPYDIMRVNDAFTLNLRQASELHHEHLAFNMDPESFDAVLARLVERRIPYGGWPSEMDSGMLGESVGARGITDVAYFADPDGHTLELCFYPEPWKPRLFTNTKQAT